jgi:hypothetical protein
MARQADSLIAVMLCTLLRQWLGNDSNDPRSRVFGYSAFRLGNSITHAETTRGRKRRTPSKEGSRGLDSYIRPAPGALTDKSASAPRFGDKGRKHFCSTSPIPQNFLTCAALTLVTSPAAGANVSSRRLDKNLP